MRRTASPRVVQRPRQAGRSRGAAAAAAAILALFLALLPDAVAAQNGRVSGLVTDATSGRPMESAQVSLVTTGLGTLTGGNGRFLILNVPPGQYTVRVDRIGYRAATSQVTVAAGETVVANFALQTEALGLDEIVVTGTAGAARKREVGNSIGQVNVADLPEPPTSVDALLQGRVTGMNVLQSSGQVGSGAMIRLRGNVSVAMSNQPILYVDGVRVRSEGTARNVPPTGSTLRSNNDIMSPLNDINPADIERIEVIKGAAATTLYGTEAAAGVIQIFTKRGREGKAVWNLDVQQGFAHEQKFGVDPSRAPPSEANTKAFCDANGKNCGTSDYLYINPWLRNGYQQSYSLSVSGGAPSLQYFASGSLDDNKGVLPLDHEKKHTIRGNFSFSPLDVLRLEWNTSFTNNDITNTPAGNNAHGITLNTFRRDRNYLASESRAAVDPLLDWQLTQTNRHLITGMTANLTASENFTNRLSVGYDMVQLDQRNYRPFGFVLAPDGILSDRRYEYTTLTADYVGSYDLQLTEAVHSTLSVGGQAVTTQTQETSAYGQDFPGPGDPTVSNAGTRLGFEARTRVVNAGFFGQAVFGIRDRYFLTGGVRVDGNSAFGQNLGLQVYPKVSASYIISDEDFWPAGWGTTKLRAAWGESGRAPGAFDAVRTYEAAGWGQDPAFLPLNVGNPNIGPERTAEFEVGFETSQLNDRVSLDFTYYHQTTSDALFNVRQIPSDGFLNSQLENIGKLQNSGIEVALNANVLRMSRFQWDVGGTVSTNKSKVLDLGGAPSFSLGNYGWVVEGQPVPVIHAACVTNPNEKADPIVQEDCNIGPNLPTHIYGMNTTLTFPGGIAVTARGEYQGGHYMEDGAAYNAVTRSVRWPGCFDAYKIEETQGYDQLTAKQRSMCDVKWVRNDFYIYPADFFKIREISLNVPIPERYIPSASRATVILSGHNVYRWVNKDFPVFEPEMGANDGFNTTVRSLLEQIPPPATFTAAVRLTF